MSIYQKASASASGPTFSNDLAMRIAFIGGRGVASQYSGIETYYEAVGSELV